MADKNPSLQKSFFFLHVYKVLEGDTLKCDCFRNFVSF